MTQDVIVSCVVSYRVMSLRVIAMSRHGNGVSPGYRKVESYRGVHVRTARVRKDLKPRSPGLGREGEGRECRCSRAPVGVPGV